MYAILFIRSAAHNKKRANLGKGRTPIEKNASPEEKRTVRIISADGETAGFTYPKRARGLVKKGRAQFVNNFEIRMNVSDGNDISEEHTMEFDNNNTVQNAQPPVTRLYFSAREWGFNKDCSNNVGYRSFMQGPDGVVAEAFMIGDWGWNWTEITSKTLILQKNTLHTFVFWLNGGENDSNNETCRFEVIFNNDYENRYTYNLNRNFIRPLRKINGWELYEIPFMTADNEYTQLRFVAQRAYMTVLAAKDPEAYAELSDVLDEFEGERPQRHNIVFDDGFPIDEWYSTRNLRAAREKAAGGAGEKMPPAAQNKVSTADAMAAMQGMFDEMKNRFCPEALAQMIECYLEDLGAEHIEEAVQDAASSIAGSIDDIANEFEQFSEAMSRLAEQHDN